jgi:WD40 repeat protein
MSHIFISYSRKDVNRAQEIVDALAVEELDTWIDWKSIPKGEDWEQEIYRGIEEADAFLFLISPDSIMSEMCNKEVIHAVRNNKRILPVVVRDTDISRFLQEMPRNEIAKRNWIFCRGERDNFEKAVAEAKQTIHTDYAWLKYHTDLQVKAARWEKVRDVSRLLRGKELRDAEIEFTNAGQKDPQPTDLQRSYILESRRWEITIRNRALTAAGVAIVVLVLLSVFAFIQRNTAVTNEQSRATAQLEAENQKGTAVANEQARATAQAIAEQNQKLAEERAMISRAESLAAQSIALRESNFSLSLLLGIEALNIRKTVQTQGTLLDNTQISPRLISNLRGHENHVNSVAVSPDGKLLASGSSDYTIILWDMETGQRIGEPLDVRPYGIGTGVESIAFSPNGELLASGGSNIILWDTKTAHPIMVMDPLIEHTTVSVAFSLDGKFLASGSYDATVIIWNVETGQPIGQPLAQHTNAVTSVAFSPDGKSLASGSLDDTIVLWNLATGNTVSHRLRQTERITSIAFSPDGKTLASGSLDNTITLWDIETGQPIGQPLSKHTAAVNTVSFSPDGTMLASGSDDGSIILWNMKLRLPIDQPLRVRQTNIEISSAWATMLSVAFSPNGKTLVSGGWDGSVYLWHTETDQPLFQALAGIGNDVSSFAISPDGKMLALGSKKSIYLWDLETNQAVGQPLNGHKRAVTSLAFNSNSQLLTSVGDSLEIFTWNTATGQPISHLLNSNANWGYNVKLVSNGKLFTSRSFDQGFLFGDTETGQLIFRAQDFGPYSGYKVAISPDGSILATVDCSYATYNNCINDEIVFRNVETQQPIGLPLNIHSDANVTELTFSADGKILASGSSDNSISLWDVEMHKRIGQPLVGHTTSIFDIAFSQDGKILASGTVRELILWDLETQQPIGQSIQGSYTPGSNGFAFGLTEKILVTYGLNRPLLLWDLDPISWIQKTCQRAGRNFTKTEWSRYFPDREYRKTCEQWPLESGDRS